LLTRNVVRKFKIFNTNNIWINLKALKRIMEDEGLELEIIVNPKQTDDGQAVIQLETAAGAAIKHFTNAHGINVPRSRFLPVKACSDLLLIKSDIYSISHGQLVMNEARMFDNIPVIKLSDHFKKIANFQKRFKKIPKIIELDHLTVTGDVYFGRNVTLRGTVIGELLLRYNFRTRSLTMLQWSPTRVSASTFRTAVYSRTVSSRVT
jgi:UTP--glucose-1-phosphate uridylyltransferase